MNAREVILERVRKAHRTGYVPEPGPKGPGLQAPAAGPKGPALQRFLAELTGVGVGHYVEPTADAVRTRVAQIIDGRRAFAWDREHLPYDVVLPGAVTGSSDRADQAAAEIGVTGCDAAIAETGSLVVLSGPGKPRGASLLPPVHLCIVRPETLHATMGEFFAEETSAIAAAASCAFITGPSRTADIELTLTLGVHGPGKVIVVVGP